jgi:hypothetical protein
MPRPTALQRNPQRDPRRALSLTVCYLTRSQWQRAATPKANFHGSMVICQAKLSMSLRLAINSVDKRSEQRVMAIKLQDRYFPEGLAMLTVASGSSITIDAV